MPSNLASMSSSLALPADPMVVFTVSNDYKHVLMVVLVIVAQYFIALIGAGAPRGKIFNQDFMENKFGKEHELGFFGGRIKKGGYPDCGSGRYTMEAGYRSWFEFNIAQRIHINYMENISQIIVLLLCTGLHYPNTTTAIGWYYVVGRLLYQLGYTYAPSARVIGMLFMGPV